MTTETTEPIPQAYTSNRDVFIDMVRILSARNWTRSLQDYSEDFNPICLYGGIGCAIGCLPPCRRFAKVWDGLGVIQSIAATRCNQFRACFSPQVSTEFLWECQSAHDHSRSVDSFRTSMRDIAAKWELADLPEDVTKALS